MNRTRVYGGFLLAMGSFVSSTRLSDCGFGEGDGEDATGSTVRVLNESAGHGVVESSHEKIAEKMDWCSAERPVDWQ